MPSESGRHWTGQHGLLRRTDVLLSYFVSPGRCSMHTAWFPTICQNVEEGTSLLNVPLHNAGVSRHLASTVCHDDGRAEGLLKNGVVHLYRLFLQAAGFQSNW